MCGTSIMGLMMLGAAMGDTITIHAAEASSRAGARAARRAGRRALRGRNDGRARQVTAFSNPTVKRLRSLRDKKARRAEGLFLAEGLRILTEARDSGRLPEIVAFSAEGRAIRSPPRSSPRPRPPAARRSRPAGHPLQDVGQGQSADAARRLSAARHRPRRIDRTRAPLWIVAQALRDPGNIGTILRTGDAVGAGGLILIDDSADPFSVEAVRASMGAIFTQRSPTARWDEFVAWLRAGEGQLVGTSLKADAGLSRGRLPATLLPADRQRAAGPAADL